MRISREPTQAVVQYRVWAGTGYTPVLKNTTPTPKKNSTFVFSIRSKEHNAYVLITKGISKISLQTEAPKYQLPQLCTWGPGWHFFHMSFPL